MNRVGFKTLLFRSLVREASEVSLLLPTRFFFVLYVAIAFLFISLPIKIICIQT